MGFFRRRNTVGSQPTLHLVQASPTTQPASFQWRPIMLMQPALQQLTPHPVYTTPVYNQYAAPVQPAGPPPAYTPSPTALASAVAQIKNSGIIPIAKQSAPQPAIDAPPVSPTSPNYPQSPKRALSSSPRQTRHTRSTSETDLTRTRALQRSHSTKRPPTGAATYAPQPSAPIHTVQATRDAGTKGYPPKMGFVHSIIDFARRRSKSRNRDEPQEHNGRPRSRSSFADEKRTSDGERGRSVDPRYDESEGARQIREWHATVTEEMNKGDLDDDMIHTVDNTVRDDHPIEKENLRSATKPLAIPTLHRTNKEDLRRRFVEDDRLRRQQEDEAEYGPRSPHSRSSSASRSSSQSRAQTSEGLSESPITRNHTQWNAQRLNDQNVEIAVQHSNLPARPNITILEAGYHTDAPPKPVRRATAPPLRIQMQQQRIDLTAPHIIHPRSNAETAPLSSPIGVPSLPKGFFNRRGDQLMNSNGDVLRRPPHLEYPAELASYPDAGRGWQDERGQVVGPDLRWIRKVG